MKREILFRGKRIDNGEWVEGMLFYTGYSEPTRFGLKPCIQVCDFNKMTYSASHEVAPDTVGQFTGLVDKNGKKIFEGDTLEKIGIDYYSPEYDAYEKGGYVGDEPTSIIKTDYCNIEKFRYWLNDETFGYEGENLESPEDWIITGNIHDNPELLTNQREQP